MKTRFTSDKGDSWGWDGPADGRVFGGLPEGVMAAVRAGAVVTDHFDGTVFRLTDDGELNVTLTVVE
jgi:hypothetical protein